MRRLFLDFQFTGRMARKDYWRMFAYRAGIVLVCFLLAQETGGDAGSGMGGEMYPGMGGEMYPEMGGESMGGDPLLVALAGLLMIWVVIPGIAEAARRLHDTGRPGWWNLLLFIPYLGWAGLLFLLAQEGNPEPNQYGPVPDASASA